MPSQRVYLGAVEELVLLTVRSLGEGSGMDVARRFGYRNHEAMTCYVSLRNLERKGFIETRGKAKHPRAKAAKMFAITDQGLAALCAAEAARRRFGEAG